MRELPWARNQAATSHPARRSSESKIFRKKVISSEAKGRQRETD